MTHLPEVLAWVLLHFVWQATIIALLYKFAESRVGADRPVTRYNLALTALLCMLGFSALTFFYEQARIGAAANSGTVFGATLAASLHSSAAVVPLLTAVHKETPQIIHFIDVAWLAGVLLFFLRAVGGAWILTRIRRASSFAPKAELAQRFLNVARHLDLHHRVTLRIHTATISPFVTGFFRSVVYLRRF